MGLCGARILCHCVFLTYFNCSGLVFSNSAEQDYLLTATRIEILCAFFDTNGMGKGQFSAPMYRTVLRSGSWTRRCSVPGARIVARGGVGIRTSVGKSPSAWHSFRLTADRSSFSNRSMNPRSRRPPVCEECASLASQGGKSLYDSHHRGGSWVTVHKRVCRY